MHSRCVGLHIQSYASLAEWMLVWMGEGEGNRTACYRLILLLLLYFCCFTLIKHHTQKCFIFGIEKKCPKYLKETRPLFLAVVLNIWYLWIAVGFIGHSVHSFDSFIKQITCASLRMYLCMGWVEWKRGNHTDTSTPIRSRTLTSVLVRFYLVDRLRAPNVWSTTPHWSVDSMHLTKKKKNKTKTEPCFA